MNSAKQGGGVGRTLEINQGRSSRWVYANRNSFGSRHGELYRVMINENSREDKQSHVSHGHKPSEDEENYLSHCQDSVCEAPWF